jgi:hypothetical protein
MNLNDLDHSSELNARELAFGEKFQYPTYRGAPRGTMSADAEVLESLNLLKHFGKCGRFQLMHASPPLNAGCTIQITC